MFDTSFWFWIAFAVLISALLVFDLGVLGRRARHIGVRQSLLLTTMYIVAALLFGITIFAWQGQEAGMAYLTAFVLEKSLSVDNIFVFVLILGHFKVPRELHHRVLFWGVLGALMMRGLMIFAGVALLRHFEWVIYIFGVIVLASGLRILITGNEPPDLEENRILGFLRRYVRTTQEYHRHHFIVREDGVRCATPLLVCLILIELTDVIFALDSIPAIFGITRDPFIIYTSNAFAILGLRALYFAVRGLVARFAYLHYGLSIVLILIGVKMLAEGIVEIPVWMTLSATLGVIAASVGLSLVGQASENRA